MPLPALLLSGGALIGIGVYVALNWDDISRRLELLAESQRLKLEALRGAVDDMLDSNEEKWSESGVEKSSTLYSGDHESDDSESPGDATAKRSTPPTSSQDSLYAPLSDGDETLVSSDLRMPSTSGLRNRFTVYAAPTNSSSDSEGDSGSGAANGAHMSDMSSSWTDEEEWRGLSDLGSDMGTDMVPELTSDLSILSEVDVASESSGEFSSYDCVTSPSDPEAALMRRNRA